jgi:hypothetical protein
MQSAAKRAIQTMCPDNGVAHLVLDVWEVRASGPWLCTGRGPASLGSRNRRVEKPVSGRHPRCELKQFDAITEVGELADHSGGALLL